MLKELFLELVGRWTSDEERALSLWDEINRAYSAKSRHYHNLTHLESLLRELQPVKASIDDWDTMLFTLVYHDIVYDALKSSNEEKSAELAVQRLQELGVPGEKVAACKARILATKGHVVSEDPDTNYFTDADLSVLGLSWDEYQHYFRAIRKEYRIYPDLVYKPGRRKVLQHFLDMPRLFKTPHFYDRYETAARDNIRLELASL